MFSYRVLRIILEGTGPRILSIIAKCSLLSWVCKKYKISKNERGKDSHRKEESDSVDNQDLTSSGSAAAYMVSSVLESSPVARVHSYQHWIIVHLHLQGPIYIRALTNSWDFSKEISLQKVNKRRILLKQSVCCHVPETKWSPSSTQTGYSQCSTHRRDDSSPALKHKSISTLNHHRITRGQDYHLVVVSFPQPAMF